MTRTRFDHFPCSIAQTLNVIEDQWAWLIIRDIRMGNRRFTGLQQTLGISKKVLTARLNVLHQHGLIELIETGNPRGGYRLTQKGQELMGVMQMMISWGDKWLYGGSGPITFTHTCGKTSHAKVVCDQCGEEILPGSMQVHPSDQMPEAEQKNWFRYFEVAET
ncbi:winged helix-turn-helix transcriptional regulator [Gynuella sunshinyii]|uniref:Putative transcriptional regulator n=1 Tax=Gynuella sunshinyii YC6258 TaxID=1445510 RepID=A0A0C5VQ23_9GAMM|nr:helix-turn-helix domain-containing protein [Gynuella sunshinyii]AJQ92384.1 putative transcriptional regulator [Gynuella sunshinyii YC6258]